MAIAEGEGRGGGGGLGKGGRGETEEEEQSPKRYMVSDTCCPNIDFGAAAPKGMKSFRTRGIPVCLFIHLSIHPFVRPPPLEPPKSKSGHRGSYLASEAHL